MIQHGITRDRPLWLLLLVSLPWCGNLVQVAVRASHLASSGVLVCSVRAQPLFLSGSIEAVWGPPYWQARGEILRPCYDEQQRRQWANLLPLIKNESKGIEDDQIPL